MSLVDYKIDYNHCLGKGLFGTVYAVVPRPQEERGILSSWFPYFYDYVYPVKEGTPQSDLCVKVYRTALKVFLYRKEWNAVLLKYKQTFTYMSLNQPEEEINTNRVLQKYGLTRIQFYEPVGRYAQIKTRIKGNTLDFHLNENTLLKKESYEMRFAFITLLKSISKCPLKFSDIHSANLMYDEEYKNWEIIDGSVVEGKMRSVAKVVSDFVGYCVFDLGKKDPNKFLLRVCGKIATSSFLYTKKKDAILMDYITRCFLVF